jgi:hypothetical protein
MPQEKPKTRSLDDLQKSVPATMPDPTKKKTSPLYEGVKLARKAGTATVKAMRAASDKMGIPNEGRFKRPTTKK